MKIKIKINKTLISLKITILEKQNYTFTLISIELHVLTRNFSAAVSFQYKHFELCMLLIIYKQSMSVLNRLQRLKKRHRISICRKYASSTAVPQALTNPLPCLTAPKSDKHNPQRSNSEGNKTACEEGRPIMSNKIPKISRKNNICANSAPVLKKKRPLVALRNINKTDIPLHKTHKCTCINSTRLNKVPAKPKSHENLKRCRKTKLPTSIGRLEKRSDSSLSTQSSDGGSQITCTTDSSIKSRLRNTAKRMADEATCVQIRESGRNYRTKRRRLLYHANNRLPRRAESAATIITISSDEEDKKPDLGAIQGGDIPPDVTLSEELELLQSVLDTLDKEQNTIVAPWPADLENINVTPLQYQGQGAVIAPPQPPPTPVASTSQGGPPWCANCSSRFWHDMVTMAKFYSVGPYSTLLATRSGDGQRKN